MSTAAPSDFRQCRLRSAFGWALACVLASGIAAVQVDPANARPEAAAAERPAHDDFDLGLRDLPAPRLVVDAQEYPWSAIGRLNFAGRGFCTAFLVGSDLAFTAAHCLYDPATGEQRALSDLHMVAGYQRDSYLAHARVAAIEVREAAPRQEEPTDSGMEADLAVLQLTAPIGINTGWLPLQMLEGEHIEQLLSGEARLMLAGYSRRRPHAMELHVPCRTAGTARAGRLLVHDCVMEEGASGAPLLLADKSGVSVVGLGSALATLGGGELRTVSVTTRSLLDAGQEPVAGRLSRYLAWPQHGAAPGVDSTARPRPDDTVQRLIQRGDQSTASGCPLAGRDDGPGNFTDPATDALQCLAEAVLALP